MAFCLVFFSKNSRSQGSKNSFLPGGKPSTFFVSFYAFSSSFSDSHHILSLFLSLFYVPSFPPPTDSFSFFPSSFRGHLTISATFLVPPLFVFLALVGANHYHLPGYLPTLEFIMTLACKRLKQYSYLSKTFRL